MTSGSASSSPPLMLEQLQTMVEYLAEGMVFGDSKGNILHFNPAALKIHGFSSMEEIFKHLNDYPEVFVLQNIDGSILDLKDWPLARVIRKEKFVDFEVNIVRTDTPFSKYVTYSGTPIFDESNEVTLAVLTIRDVTEARKLAAEIKHQAELTKTITDNAASGLFMMDKKGHPTFMNPAAMEITGYGSVDEIKDRPLHYAVHWKKPDGSHYPMEECPIDNAQAELKEAKNQEEIFCRKDGTLFPVSYSVMPLEKDGDVIGSVLEFRDITEQKRAEDKLKLKEESLTKALKARDEFLSIASHELRTPITSLQMQLQMAKRNIDPKENKVPSAEKLLKTFDISIIQVNRLTNLIENLLDVSRIEAGKISFTIKKIDFSKLVLDIAALYCDQLKLEDYKIINNTSEPIIVSCDPYRIEQVVINLLTNAAKYGEGKPIQIEISKNERNAKLVVKDQGPGISKEHQAKIFDRFERAISHDNISGLGLGLYISKSIVLGHKGNLRVESELGKGSSFIVELPLEQRP